MEREKMNELIIEYIDGNLQGEQKEFVEEQLKFNKEFAALYEELKESIALLDSASQLEPDATLRIGFGEMLANELERDERVIDVTSSRPAWSISPVQIAAAVTLVVSGVFLGTYINRSMSDKPDIAQLQEEIQLTKELLIKSLDSETSASSRLKSVNATYKTGKADDDIVKALIKTMNTDENTNVRLAAVQALAHFSQEPYVRQVLIDALETQKDTMVQISLINLMVQWKEKSAIDRLQKIINNEEIRETVKDEAHMAVFKLS